MANFRYFSTCQGQTVELINAFHSGAVSTKAREFTGNCSLCSGRHQAERKIERKRNPSNHKCDARCMSATGFLCECSSGGKNHGAGNFMCEAA
jgi:hypothetical protein